MISRPRISRQDACDRLAAIKEADHYTIEEVVEDLDESFFAQAVLHSKGAAVKYQGGTEYLLDTPSVYEGPRYGYLYETRMLHLEKERTLVFYSIHMIV